MSLGQGQEVVAEDALDVAAEKGHWVILQVPGAGLQGGGAPARKGHAGHRHRPVGGAHPEFGSPWGIGTAQVTVWMPQW